MDIMLEMRGVQKSFHNNRVNDGVDFALRRGEIHALLGENGAGKTTLMNILYGLYDAEAGEIILNGEEVEIRDPIRAISLGIGMVHQHFMLVEPMSVYENIVLGVEETRAGFLRTAESRRAIEQLEEESGLFVNLDAKIKDLPIGEKQRVEILKVLYRGARILILDEPTAVLTPQETDELFVILRRLRDKGTSIILITHKMRETFAVCDHITVMRRGKVVADVAAGETTPGELAVHMVGRQVNMSAYPRSSGAGKTMLRVTDLCTNQKDAANLDHISFEIPGGTILGIAGVDGNGQSQLAGALVGVLQASGGTIALDGTDITARTPNERMEAGVYIIPEDRNSMGLVADFDVAENLLLGFQRRPEFGRLGFLNWGKLREIARRRIQEYDIQPAREELPARSFSGGNQQKIIVARELSGENVKLVIAAQPTRGLDIGAAEFVHKKLLEMRDQGAAILLISTVLEEVRNISDQIAVLYEGKILAQDASDSFTEETLGLLMAGKVS